MHNQINAQEFHRSLAIAAFVITGLFVVAFYRTAWIAEDAFITFRVVENWIEGYGLRWNIDERVQAFTHPLWLLVLTPIVMLTSDPYWAATLLSLACLLSFIAMALRAMNGINFISLLAVLTLLWSKSFIDFSSSGLENPLTHLLLAIFVLTWNGKSTHRTRALYFLGSLIYLNRPDAVVLVMPALAAALIVREDTSGRVSSGRVAAAATNALIGLTPAALWTLFSLAYYGSPVPNTAIAKVSNGMGLAQSALQAGHLVAYVWKMDPICIASIAGGWIAGMSNRKLRAIALGLPLWAIYLIYVGGDYMGGRFFTAPLVVAILILGGVVYQKWIAVMWASILLLLSPLLSYTLFSPVNYSNDKVTPEGIADERGFYYEILGLRPVLRAGSWEISASLTTALAFREKVSDKADFIGCNVGMLPFALGPNAHVIDPLALTDAFLARVPAATINRVGHYERALPDGYLESVVTGTNHLKEKALQNLWNDVQKATRSPVFSYDRFLAVLRLNLSKRLYQPMDFDRDSVNFNGRIIRKSSIFTCLGEANWRLHLVPEPPRS